MNQQLEYFKQAELALASYGNFVTEIPDQSELERVGFSPAQARDSFIPKYRIVTQYSDSTGLSVTVFKSTDAQNPQTFLAIRGTDPNDPGDILADLLTATFGTTVMLPQYASLKAQVQTWLNDGTLPQTFTVTGHSLGGVLATGLVDDPDVSSHISHAYLYNAPGQGGIVGSLVNTLLGFMGLSPLNYSSKISNIEDQTQACLHDSFKAF